jgi:cell division protease FtsH
VVDDALDIDSVEEADAALEAVSEESEEPEHDPYEEFRNELRFLPGKWFVIHSYAGFERRVKANIEQRRESMALSEKEKELTAYHEAGHAVCATVLEEADPVHKVTILPMGMALGVTQQLPQEDKHSYNRDYLDASIVVAMGGRIAEKLIFGVVSTGANNDLVVSTERARKMVREWGMSDRVGPMAWGSQGQVFLGEDLMHNARDYSDDTARVIDQETEKILRACEQRCLEVLTEHRNGLDLVARGLLEHETIDGAECVRLVDLGKSAPAIESTTGTEAYAGSEATTVSTDKD